jgi:hypothetical protein
MVYIIIIITKERWKEDPFLGKKVEPIFPPGKLSPNRKIDSISFPMHFETQKNHWENYAENKNSRKLEKINKIYIIIFIMLFYYL